MLNLASGILSDNATDIELQSVDRGVRPCSQSWRAFDIRGCLHPDAVGAQRSQSPSLCERLDVARYQKSYYGELV
jgi:hypothetical protein